MKYTVILQRPDYVTDDFGFDIYTAFVDEANINFAVAAARDEVRKVDDFEGDSKDYAVLIIFKGHIMAEPYPYDVG